MSTHHKLKTFLLSGLAMAAVACNNPKEKTLLAGKMSATEGTGKHQGNAYLSIEERGTDNKTDTVYYEVQPADLEENNPQMDNLSFYYDDRDSSTVKAEYKHLSRQFFSGTNITNDQNNTALKLNHHDQAAEVISGNQIRLVVKKAEKDSDRRLKEPSNNVPDNFILIGKQISKAEYAEATIPAPIRHTSSKKKYDL